METKTTTCQHCLEETPDSSLSCQHCGELLQGSEVQRSTSSGKTGTILRFFEDINVAPLPALVFPLVLAIVAVFANFL